MLLVNGMVMQLEHVHIPEALSAALHRNSLLPSLDANAVLWNNELLFTDRFLPLDRLPKVVQDFVCRLGFAPFNDGELHQDLNDPQPNFLQVVEEKRPKQVPVHDDVVKVVVELLGVGHGFLYLLNKVIELLNKICHHKNHLFPQFGLLLGIERGPQVEILHRNHLEAALTGDRARSEDVLVRDRYSEDDRELQSSSGDMGLFLLSRRYGTFGGNNTFIQLTFIWLC